MKKILSLFMVFVLSLVLVGCNDTDTKEEDDNKQEEKEVVDTEKEEIKEEVKVPELVIGKTYKWESNGSGETIVFNKNGSTQSNAWGKDAGSTKYKGTYVVTGNKVTVTDKYYYDIMEWSRLPKAQVFEYTIVDEDTISRVYNGKEFIYNIS